MPRNEWTGENDDDTKTVRVQACKGKELSETEQNIVDIQKKRTTEKKTKS